ncbi:putative Translation initiation factor eIF-2B subunit alpha [Blattamonas nauphoetae]|uniref:Translation initiation factor eIF2B subunit alpha n=1 Tax=Blattamonas nauphoetae TaxID=2049346 RepID=A0ABQ9XT74_9EUKA|nr:putative Translation initiation factor eIF-2B subunit alpha [Blattamonas nauphoetae]
MNEQSVCDIYNEKRRHHEDATATRLALIEVVKRTGETTFQGFQQTIKNAIETLCSQNPTNIIMKPVTDLFFQDLRIMSVKQIHEIKEEMRQKEKDVIDEPELSRKEIAKHAIRFFRDGLKVLTYSKSRAVAKCLDYARQEFSFTVYALQGGDNSGQEFLASLERFEPFQKVLVPDIALSTIISEIDTVLVGAVAVTENGGIINKTGTRTVSSIALEHQKDFFVAAESYKFSKLYPLSQGHLRNLTPLPPLRTITTPPQDAVLFDCPEFDYTPPSFIRCLLTEVGVKTPADACVSSHELYNRISKNGRR